tara:strand:- start:243 stop:1352 length:1110 start_codon:yes stop_codon:yes gene_type:complete
MSKIGKIVELLIDWDDLEFDDLGVEIMSLVEKPAIGISWQAFADVEFRENSECPDGFEHQMPDGSYMCGKEHEYEETDEIILMASQPDFGEVLDYNETIEISATEANFGFTDTLKAIIGLDILGKKDPKEEGEIKYRYSGPAAQREFCRAMQRLNKVYTSQEIDRMSGLNPGFGARGSNTYNIFKYKGGPNCQHYWEQVRVFRDGRKTVVVSEGPARGLGGEAMEEQPNSGYLMSQWNFSEDDQMIITGPAMTPNVLIPRKDEEGNTFHVMFSAETIEKISRKFLEESKHNNTDINHDDSVTTENTLLESWLVKDPEMDQSKAMNFDVPKGTWFVSYKINNKDTWQKIKNGELNGFSITGQFIEKALKK